MRFRPSAWKKRSRNSDKVNHQKADARVPAFFRGGKIRFFTESWWGANKGLGEAPKSCTRKEHESATDSIARRGQGGTSSLFVCPLQGQGTASLVGFGATPQLLVGRSAQRKKSTKGAGSEASLPLTLRVRRRAPKLLFPQDSVKNQSKGKAKGRSSWWERPFLLLTAC